MFVTRFVLVIILFIADRLLKYLAVDHDGFFVLSKFSFGFTKNSGIALSLDIPSFISVPLAIVFIGYLIWLLYQNIKKKNQRRSFIISLVIVGGLSNLLDRIRYGYVIDYFGISWPFSDLFFNLADVLVVVGIVWLMLDMWLQGLDSSDAEEILFINQVTYDQVAPAFSQSRDKQLWPEINQFKKYLKKNDKVLDIGCGNGRLLRLFGDLKVEYTGLDNSRALLEEAKKKAQTINQKTKFQVGDMRDLPFADGTYDAIFMIASLNHLPYVYHQKVLQEVHRVLKPGGYLLMTNFNLWRLSLHDKTIWNYKLRNRAARKKELAKHFKGKLGLKDVMTFWNHYPLYYYAFTLRELKRRIKQIGFKILTGAHFSQGKKVWWGRANNLVLICKK